MDLHSPGGVCLSCISPQHTIACLHTHMNTHTQALELLCNAAGAMACECVLGWWQPPNTPSASPPALPAVVVNAPTSKAEIGLETDEASGEKPNELAHQPSTTDKAVDRARYSRGRADSPPASPRGRKRANDRDGDSQRTPKRRGDSGRHGTSAPLLRNADKGVRVDTMSLDVQLQGRVRGGWQSMGLPTSLYDAVLSAIVYKV